MTDLTFNGTEVTSVDFNGTDCNNVYFNGVKVWSKGSNLIAGSFVSVIVLGSGFPNLFFYYTGFSITYSSAVPQTFAAGSLTPNPTPNLVQTGAAANTIYTLASYKSGSSSSSSVAYQLRVQGWKSAETVTLNAVSITGVFETGGQRTITLNFGTRTTDANDIATWTISGMSSDDGLVSGNSYLVSAG